MSKLRQQIIQKLEDKAREPAYPLYKATQSKILGYFQIFLCGLCSLVTGAVACYYVGPYKQKTERDGCLILQDGPGVNDGVIFGPFYIIAGGFALGAGIHRSKCMVVANLTLSIIAALFAFIQMAEFAVALGVVNVYGCKDNDADPDFHNKHVLALAIFSLELVYGILEFAFCIWSAVLCCMSTCGQRGNAGYQKIVVLQMKESIREYHDDEDMDQANSDSVSSELNTIY